MLPHTGFETTPVHVTLYTDYDLEKSAYNILKLHYFGMPYRKHTTKARNALIRQKYINGISVPKLSEEFEITNQRIYQVVKLLQG